MSTYRSASIAPSPRVSARIRQSPLPLVALFVVIVVMGAAAFGYQASRYAGLSCRREPDRSGACTVRTGTILGHHDHTVPLSAIRGARVEQVSEGRSRVHRVVLDTTRGAFVLGRGGSRAEREVDASAIDTFLRGAAPGIFVERYGSRARAFPWFVGGLALALAIGAFMARVADVELRVEGDRLVVRRRGLRGVHVLARVGLDEVDDVIVHQSGKDAYRVVLTTKLGERISLEHHDGPGHERRAEVADRLRAFVRSARSQP